MDQNGYDAVWIAEHHFSTYSVCPSVHMMGTHFAANTTNLRIGTGVSLAAFYDPLRLAEEVQDYPMVDVTPASPAVSRPTRQDYDPPMTGAATKPAEDVKERTRVAP